VTLMTRGPVVPGQIWKENDDPTGLIEVQSVDGEIASTLCARGSGYTGTIDVHALQRLYHLVGWRPALDGRRA
jgi:hypothetical protein